MSVTDPNESRWDAFSDEELETIRQSLLDSYNEGLLDLVGAALLTEIENEIDSR
jgi:hypothetical protein